MVKFEDKKYEDRYMDMMKKVISGLSTAIKARKSLNLPRYPAKPQDIPDYFVGADLKQPDAILGALYLSKENDLMPVNTPLRQMWYTFVKLTLQKLKKQKMHQVSAFYTNLKMLIEHTDLMYADFNILNPPDKYTLTSDRPYFPNVLIGLEKKSYYDFFTRFANLIGVHLLAAGGQPSYSGTEEVARQIVSRTGKGKPTGRTDYFGKEVFTEQKYLPELNIIAVSDYDPSGLNIGNAIANQFDSHMSRRYETTVKGYRATPTLDDYTPEELTKAPYNVKSSTVGQKNWNTEEQRNARLAHNFVDERFKDISIYDDTKGSWLMKFLAGETNSSPKKSKAWIAKWKARIEADPDDYPHMFGLEVESLPREPLPHQLPTGFVWNGSGQARAKLFTFEELERLYPDGVNSGYKEWMKKNFKNINRNETATNTIEGMSGLDDFDAEKTKIDDIYRIIRDFKQSTLKDDIAGLEEQIKEWASEEYSEIIADDNNFQTYRDNLIKAIANDDYKFTFDELIKNSLPEIPDEVLEFEIDEGVIDNIQGNTDKIAEKRAEICEVLEEELPTDWEELKWLKFEYSFQKDEYSDKIKKLCPDITSSVKGDNDEDDEYD